MYPKILKQFLSFILSLTIVLLSLILMGFNNVLKATAILVDYAPQLMNIALYDDSKNLTVLDITDKTKVSFNVESGTLNEQWRIDYCGENSVGNYYKIVNASSGRLLTPYGYSVTSGTDIVIYGNENDHSQYWYILPVSKDSYGNDLYYKIVNYSNSNLALTSNSDNATLETYNDSNNQKWLLNCAGLDGFAGYCKDNDGNIKASVTGGLLGPTIEVTTFDELKEACISDTTQTIVITKDISMTTDNYLVSGNGRLYWRDNTIYIHPNKTVIGSYSAHSTYNVYFATYGTDSFGKGSNFIIKNLTVSHDTELNADNIYDFPYGINIWIDHITFEGHENLDSASTGLADWDKFLCIYQDADFSTVSNCTFGHHHYGCLYGYPADTEENYQIYNGKPYITLVSNYYKDCITRAPGLLRYGFYHSINNYVYNVNLGYTLYTASTLYDENNYYDAGSNSGKIVNDAPNQGGGDDTSATHLCAYAMSGSVIVNSNYELKPTYALATTWQPSNNYKYSVKTAKDSKTYCETYSGAQSTKDSINFNNYANSGVTSAMFMVKPDEDWETITDTLTPSTMAIDTYYMIKNANSNLYLDVANGSAKNGANVQQWGATIPEAQNTWRFFPAEDGYYYIQSMVGNKTYVLDITDGKYSNGTNIEIYNYKGNDNQKFMICQNSNGTFKIVPKISNGTSFLEIEGASVASGDNCQLWENTNSSCQDWILEEVSYTGEVMDTSLNYMFKNLNSDLYMEVENGSTQDSSNIQQWNANGSNENNSADWNSWTLKSVTGDLYYIVSNLSSEKYITMNNGNAEISTKDTSNNLQMMRFVKNPNGTYYILPRSAYDKTSNRYTKALEVADADTSLGGNIQQYEINGATCQMWIIETFNSTTVTETTTEPIIDVPIVEYTYLDLLALKKYILSITSTTIDNMDINKDGHINCLDVIALKSILIESF